MNQDSQFELFDLGDASTETKQHGPGPYADSIWVWGVRPGFEE